MNDAFFKLIALFCVISMVSCSSQSTNSDDVVENPTYGVWQDLEQSPIAFELEQTFGNNRDIMFPSIGRLQGPVADAEGNIYVIDGEKGTMYSFAPNGDLRWKKGKKGRGPGDFERPRGLVTNGEFLYTANVSGSRIDQFDLEGNLINTTTLEPLGLSFISVEGILSDSLLIASSTIMGDFGVEVTILNTADNFDKVSQFKIFASTDLDLPPNFGSGFDIAIIDSLIAAGNIQDYAIQFYNSDGEKIKTIKRDFDKLMRSGYVDFGSSQVISGYGSLNAPTLLSEDYFLTTLDWPTNVDDPDQFLRKSWDNPDAPEVMYAYSMDLYSNDGRLLYSREGEGNTPEIGTITYVDSQGNIYTKTNEPFPQIRRYNFTITSPNENKMAKESIELNAGG